MFVTLEGIDRSGKTTQAAMLAEALGERTLLLREPGGTEAGERIRELLRDPSVGLSAGAELLLFCAARAELCGEVIKPAREAGRDVVCDRFTDSTVAYQGVGRGLGIERVEQLNSLVIGSVIPDLTVLLRLAPELAASRRKDGADRFEAEGLDFQRRVGVAYDELAVRHPDRIVVIEAEGERQEIHARVLRLVEERR